jgi:hypothetical protein
MRHRLTLLALLGAIGLVTHARADDPPAIIYENVVPLFVERMGFPKAVERAERTLRALPGVRAAGLSAEDELVHVRFDPARIEVEAIQEALRRDGFATCHAGGPMRYAADHPAVRIEASSRSGLTEESDGKWYVLQAGQVELVLRVKPGWRLGGEGQQATSVAVISTTLDGVGASNARYREALEGERRATFAYGGPPSQRHEVTLRIDFQARRGDGPSQPPVQVRLRLPAGMYEDHGCGVR